MPPSLSMPYSLSNFLMTTHMTDCRTPLRLQEGGPATLADNPNTLSIMPHQTHDRISLALAQRVAAGLPDHPEWIGLALANLEQWSRRNAGAPGLIRSYEEWREILHWPVEEIRSLLISDTEEGQRLRQNSPFAGALSPEEVWEIKRGDHDTRAA